MANPDINLRSAVLTLRASPRVLAVDWHSRIRSAPLAAILGAAGLLIYGAVRDPSTAGWLISGAAVILVIATPNALARANARARVTSQEVSYRGVFLATHRCARPELARLVRLRLTVLGPRFVFTRLLFVDTKGHARISLQTEWFQPADLERLQAELAVPCSDAGDPLGPHAANRLYPGAASFALVHRFEFVVLGAVVALLVIGLLTPGPLR